jgi:hypothetical protein
MTELPFIDAHSVAVDVPPERAWDAIVRMLPSFGGPAGPVFARLVGCADVSRPEPGPGIPSSIVGFRVAEAVRPSVVTLQGQHRFSRYELRFVIEPGVVRAETRAAFPGLAGRLYKTAVISTGVHVVAVRRMLAAIRRGSERPA